MSDPSLKKMMGCIHNFFFTKDINHLPVKIGSISDQFVFLAVLSALRGRERMRSAPVDFLVRTIEIGT